MKIAVTGGSGFIGSATVTNGLAKGHDIWTVDRQSGCDILKDLGALKGAETVIHLAGVLGTAELFDDIEDAVDVNVRGAVRIMKWCMQNDAIYIGILMPDVFPSIYTATKIATQRLANALVNAGRLQVGHVRAFNAYGPRQAYGPGHPQKIVPTFAIRAWQRQPIPIWGSGQQAVDLIHSDDIGRMLIDTAVLVKRGHQNIVLDGGTGIKLSVNQVAAIVAETTGWEYTIRWDKDENRGDQTHARLSCAAYFPMRDGEIESQDVEAKGVGWELLDWRPRFDIDLLRETVHWYRDRA